MKLDEYRQAFGCEPPAHLLRDGVIVCPTCLKKEATLGSIMGTKAVFECQPCQERKKRWWDRHPHLGGYRTKFALKAANYSPEELLSGADLGITDCSWGKSRSTKTHSEEKAAVVSTLKEELNG